MVSHKELPALRPAQERLLPFEVVILDLYRGGDNFKTILGVLDREHGVKVASGTLRSFIRSRLELDDGPPEDLGDQPTLIELLAPLQEEIAGVHEGLASIKEIYPELVKMRELIEEAGKEFSDSARHIQEQRGASVYDYLQRKLRGVWIRFLLGFDILDPLIDWFRHRDTLLCFKIKAGGRISAYHRLDRANDAYALASATSDSSSGFAPLAATGVTVSRL